MSDRALTAAPAFRFPDTEKILAGLKPFQRQSADYVFHRLYGPGYTRRFLLADDLVACLLDRLSPSEIQQNLDRFRNDLSPPSVGLAADGLGTQAGPELATAADDQEDWAPSDAADPATSGDSTADDKSSHGEGRSTPAPIWETERVDVMATIREVFSSGGPRDREQAFRDIAFALGYKRTGSRIREVLDRDIQTAVRRGILENRGGQLSLLCRGIEQYTLDHLIAMLLAAIGGTWWDREQAIIATARHLGFRRTGQNIRAAFKFAINAAIRRGLLERSGADQIRKVS